VEVLFKAKMRVVFSEAAANEDMKKKLDAIRVDLDTDKKDVLSVSGSEITNDKTITCIVVVLSKTEKTYNLPTYLEKIRIKIAEVTKADGLKLIDINII
jgi:hypothetical protein